MSGVLNGTDVVADDNRQRVVPAATIAVPSTIGSKKESQATAIVRLATEAGIGLFHTPSGDSHITIMVDGHREHHRLKSRASRDFLVRLFFLETHKAPNATALQNAINTLSGIATFEGESHEVHVRVAGDNDVVYLDLGDPAWRAIEITCGGWKVVSDPPVRFRRPRGLMPLPVPIMGGSLNELRPFVNVNHDEFPLVCACLIAALRARGPYIVLDLLGEQGSAKSTTARVIRRMIDPHEAELRRPPRNTEDVMIAATNSYLVTVDNVSSLPDWLSDDLAVLATGGGLSKRELYSDAEECILRAQRPIIVNGIGHVVTRADLLDRAIVLNLPVIPDDHRRPEADFWREFKLTQPRILGALLDAVVMALRNVSTTTLEKLPRMADFAIWNVAAEPACPWPIGTFIRAYLGNRQAAVEVSLEGDPVVDVVRAVAPWVGTAMELLELLTAKTNDNITKRKEWFTRPRQVADAMRRLAPGLRRIGIDVTFSRASHTGRRLIHIGKIDDLKTSSPSSPGSPETMNQPAQGDAPDGSFRHSPSSSPECPNKMAFGDAGDAGDVPLPVSSGEIPHDGLF